MPMNPLVNLLAFDTSTDSMSIAVQRGSGTAAQVWQHTGAGGAQASTHLIPAITALMAQAGLEFKQLTAIAFGRGPGSFTGLRTSCSVAQGLAFGAGIPVLPVDTLLCVAEEARFLMARPGVGPADKLEVLALLDARMDEVYAARCSHHQGQWNLTLESTLLRPEALSCQGVDVLAGNVFQTYADRLPQFGGQNGGSIGGSSVHALPTATALLRLAPQLLAVGRAVAADQALPLYIRDKVAQTTEERLALKRLATTS